MLPRNCWGQYLRSSLPQDWKMLPVFFWGASQGGAPVAMALGTTETAKSPIIAGMKSTPASRSEEPKVKRGTPAGLFRPMVATKRPMKRLIIPLSGEEAPMKTAQVSPSSAIQKYSAEENLSAISARAGVAKIRT